ncbi:hypothetical protein PFISCL1PPCAC_18848, partial [Pristionchus fissidentatus]
LLSIGCFARSLDDWILMMILRQVLLFIQIFWLISCFEQFIDFGRCGKETECYARETCFDEIGADATQMKKIATNLQGLFVGKSCDVIIQLQLLTPSSILVTVQLNGTYSGENYDPVFGVELFQAESQFKCSSNAITADAKFTIAKHGSRQISNKDFIFCSFALTLKKANEEFVATFNVKKYEDRPKLLYHLIDNKEASIELPRKGHYFWTLPQPDCDANLIKTNDGVLRGLLLSSIDATKSEISCTSPSKLLLIVGSEEKFIEEMRCINKRFNYTGGGVNGVVVNRTTFDLYCSEEFSSLCAPLAKYDCSACTESRRNGSKSICDGDKWRWSDGRIITSTVSCAQSKTGNDRASGWFITVDGKEEEITEGSCSTELDCRTFSNLDLSCAGKGCVQPNLSADNKSITCPKDYELNLETHTAASIKCNSTDGLYYDDLNRLTKRHSKITCQRMAVTNAQKATSSPIGIALGVTIPLLLFIGIGIVVICLVLRKRRRDRERVAPESTNPNYSEVKTGRAMNSKEHTTTKTSSEPPVSTDRHLEKESVSSEPNPMEKRKSEKSMGEKGEEKKKEEKKEERKEEKKKEEKK